MFLGYIHLMCLRKNTVFMIIEDLGTLAVTSQYPVQDL